MLNFIFKFYRGLKANLPPVIDHGVPAITMDTHEMYVGTGTNIIKISDVRIDTVPPAAYPNKLWVEPDRKEMSIYRNDMWTIVGKDYTSELDAIGVNLTDVWNAISQRALVGHTHNYANQVHFHNIADVNQLTTTLNNKSDVGHTHNLADLVADPDNGCVTDAERAFWNSKQDHLVAGTNITINPLTNVISSQLDTGGDMRKSVYDTNNNGIVDRAHIADIVDWTGVTNKPDVYPPEEHNAMHDSRYASKSHNHLPGDINTDEFAMFVSQDEKDYWNGKADYGQGGTASPLRRYIIGTNCYVTATGIGVTMGKNNNAITLNKNLVEIVSASLHFTEAEIGSNTSVTITLDFNSDYTAFYCPNVQVYRDLAGSRALKQHVAVNLDAPSTIQITGLTENEAIFVNISF